LWFRRSPVRDRSSTQKADSLRVSFFLWVKFFTLYPGDLGMFSLFSFLVGNLQKQNSLQQYRFSILFPSMCRCQRLFCDDILNQANVFWSKEDKEGQRA
jgi:hypothetical protein